jgi:thioredoxin:protein disulfide reductase
MKTLLAAILLLFGGQMDAIAQTSNPGVSARIVKPSAPLIPGKTAVIQVEIVIPSPYHINSDRPLDEFLIPTTLKFESKEGVQFGKATFPPAQVRKFKFSNEPMSVYEGAVTATVEVIPAANLTKKEIDIQGIFGYQACNDEICLPPVKEALAATLPIHLAGSASKSENEVSYSPPDPPASKPASSEKASSGAVKPVSDFEDKSLFVIFLLVFAGGLALNLTPCVYPMIPITITYFGGQAQGRKGSLFIHSVLYTIGMAATYSILGVAAAMTGGLLGSALRYPAVLIGISCIMTLLALSMFDVYEFRMPAFLNRLAGGSQKGFVGTFLMGLTVGIVAAPCIGPFVLGLLTYVGNKGNVVLGFMLFFVLALGLGIPFLVLGIFSGSIRRLPRSGAWMIWVRKIFGFVLVAMAVHFLETLFPNSLTYRLTFSMVLFLAGIYMAWIDPTKTEGKFFPIIRNLVGIAFFAAAIYSFSAGLADQFAGGVMHGRMPDMSDGKSIQWSFYSEDALVQALRQSKPIFIDFYADWCAPCKELDRYTFSSPEVVSLSKSFLMLKVDLTSADDPQTEALTKKYHIKGFPTLVFLKPDGTEISELRAVGFEPKETFAARMRQALQQAVVPGSAGVSPAQTKE